MRKKCLYLFLSALLFASSGVSAWAYDAEVAVYGGETESYNDISTNKDTGASIDASDGGDASLGVQNDVGVNCSDEDMELAVGIEIIADNNGSAGANVGGSINVKAEEGLASTGIQANGDDGGTVAVQANGIQSESKNGYASGIEIYACDGSSESLSIGSDGISVTGSGAEGIVLNSEGSSVTVDVDGGINVKGTGDDATDTTGIRGTASDSGSLNVSVGGDVKTEGPNAAVIELEVLGGTTANVNIGGNIAGENTASDSAASGEKAGGLNLDASGSGTKIDARVGGNITVNGPVTSAVEIVANNGAAVDVVAEGTVSGGTESPIVFAGDPGKISLVIWKAQESKDGSLVKENVLKGDKLEQERNQNAEALEKSIHYIIKADPSQGIEFKNTKEKTYTAPDGTVMRYNTAKESEQVVLKLSIPPDYELKGVYKDLERTSILDKDADGNYYLLVPRGGGVYVNMQLVPIDVHINELLEKYANPEEQVEIDREALINRLKNSQNEMPAKLQTNNDDTSKALKEQFEALKSAQENPQNALTTQENLRNALTKQLEDTKKSLNEAMKARDNYQEKYKNATKAPARPETPSRAAALSKNNAIGDGYGGYIAQGGHVQINGGKSNVTFTLAAPTSGVLSSATQYANSVGGRLLHCVTTSSPGVSFKTATVNFTVTGVGANDPIAVYQLQGKNWVQVLVSSITDNHVTVNLTQHGPLAFVRINTVLNATH
ncbi:MAG: hypothetical protein IJU77_03340 [Butyrivibrio sp.]|nr:hypothetical protein [Butyrivibrio sp.]